MSEELRIDQWGRVRDLFEAAAAREPSQRQAFLEAAGEDEAVCREVLALLEADSKAEEFLSSGPDISHEVLEEALDRSLAPFGDR
ncbi:MAG: hypothetical protein KDD47_13220, partial [Acidobacteria bacterium]|nr:hypothetical protein [Acidobacteriota bacterium]